MGFGRDPVWIERRVQAGRLSRSRAGDVEAGFVLFEVGAERGALWSRHRFGASEATFCFEGGVVYVLEVDRARFALGVDAGVEGGAEVGDVGRLGLEQKELAGIGVGLRSGGQDYRPSRLGCDMDDPPRFAEAAVLQGEDVAACIRVGGE